MLFASLNAQGVEFHDELAALEEQFGAPRGEPGQWASCLRVVDPATLSTVFVQVGEGTVGPVHTVCHNK